MVVDETGDIGAASKSTLHRFSSHPINGDCAHAAEDDRSDVFVQTPHHFCRSSHKRACAMAAYGNACQTFRLMASRHGCRDFRASEFVSSRWRRGDKVVPVGCHVRSRMRRACQESIGISESKPPFFGTAFLDRLRSSLLPP